MLYSDWFPQLKGRFIEGKFLGGEIRLASEQSRCNTYKQYIKIQIIIGVQIDHWIEVIMYIKLFVNCFYIREKK